MILINNQLNIVLNNILLNQIWIKIILIELKVLLFKYYFKRFYLVIQFDKNYFNEIKNNSFYFWSFFVNFNETPLHLAIRKHYTKVVEILLQNEKIDVNIRAIS